MYATQSLIHNKHFNIHFITLGLPIATGSRFFGMVGRYMFESLKNEDSENNRKPKLRMNNGQLIPHVEKCIH